MKSDGEEFMRSKVREYVMAKRKLDAMRKVKASANVSLKDKVSNDINLDYAKSRVDSLEEDLRNT